VRILSNGLGSTTPWTFIQPHGLSDKHFEDQLKNFEKEIENWKRILFMKFKKTLKILK
jgi:hypothetical protein